MCVCVFGFTVKQEMVRLHSELALVQRDREEIEKLQQTVAEKAASLVGSPRMKACVVATIDPATHCTGGTHQSHTQPECSLICHLPQQQCWLCTYVLE